MAADNRCFCCWFVSLVVVNFAGWERSSPKRSGPKNRLVGKSESHGFRVLSCDWRPFCGGWGDYLGRTNPSPSLMWLEREASMWLHRPRLIGGVNGFQRSMILRPTPQNFVPNIAYTISGWRTGPNPAARSCEKAVLKRCMCDWIPTVLGISYENECPTLIDVHWRESIRQNCVTRLGFAQEGENKGISPRGSSSPFSDLHARAADLQSRPHSLGCHAWIVHGCAGSDLAEFGHERPKFASWAWWFHRLTEVLPHLYARGQGRL